MGLLIEHLLCFCLVSLMVIFFLFCVAHIKLDDKLRKTFALFFSLYFYILLHQWNIWDAMMKEDMSNFLQTYTHTRGNKRKKNKQIILIKINTCFNCNDTVSKLIKINWIINPIYANKWTLPFAL